MKNNHLIRSLILLITLFNITIMVQSQKPATSLKEENITYETLKNI